MTADLTPPAASQQPPGCVALTGATGFVGGHILHRLAAAGWRVRALTRRPGGLAEASSVTAVPGDLESEAALAELVAGADAVVHCAGLVAARSAAEFHRVNAAGTARLLRAAAAAGVRRFVLISSLAAREPQLSPYAASKREAEAALRAAGGGLSWQVLRPPVVYGPADRATLPLFRQFARGLVLRPAGGGRFSMLYVEDLAAAVAALLAAAPPSGLVTELHDAMAAGYGWDDILAVAERQFGRRIRALPVPQPVQRAAAALATLGASVTGRPAILSQGKVNEIAHPDWVCRHALLDDCISWAPAVGLDEGFSRTAAWYKAAGWL
ncbi:MAG: NAD-dependent epimerase/dehydratase family protein [Kiloniellaceae bacterium]